jgi:MHS family citrate/tricarballylate:H+ symporter-like MFS transporter
MQDSKPGSPIATVLRVTSGNSLETFDYFLFGLCSAYTAKAIFPGGSDFDWVMLVSMMFGADLSMRPLGSSWRSRSLARASERSA